MPQHFSGLLRFIFGRLHTKLFDYLDTCYLKRLKECTGMPILKIIKFFTRYFVVKLHYRINLRNYLSNVRHYVEIIRNVKPFIEIGFYIWYNVSAAVELVVKFIARFHKWYARNKQILLLRRHTQAGVGYKVAWQIGLIPIGLINYRRCIIFYFVIILIRVGKGFTYQCLIFINLKQPQQPLNAAITWGGVHVTRVE